MGSDKVPESQVDPNRLRRVMLIPLGWLAFVSLFPDFLMRVFRLNVPWVSATAAGVGILLLCGFTAYLLMKIRTERRLVFLVLVGTALLLASESFRIAQSLHLLDNPAARNWFGLLRPLDNLLNGLGLVLIGLAFFNSIVELLAAKQRLMTDHARLSEEVARRKQVEDSLRENEAVLEAISVSALDAVILMDNAGRVHYWNPSAERILGYSADEIIGKPVHETFVPACYREAYAKGLLAWQRTGQGSVIGHTTAFRAVRKDGVEIEIEVSVSSVLIGGQWFAVGILRDVTARKRAEAEALEARQRYVDLVNNLPVAVYRNTPGPHGRFLEMNPAHVRMFEAESKEQMMAHEVRDLYRDPDRRQAISDKLMKDGFARNEEVELITLKGTPIWGAVSAVVNKGEHGEIFFDGVIQDITQRKHAEEQHRMVLRTAMDGFWIVDAGGRFLDVNEACCRLLGYSREELLAMSIQDVEETEAPDDVAAHIQRIRATGEDRFESRHRRKDATVVDVEVSATFTKEAGGMQYVFLRDITERKRAEKALLSSEAKYRDLVQNANTIIIRLDLAGRITFFNEFAQKYFGYSEDEVLGRSILGTILPEDGTPGHDLAALLRDSQEHPDHSLDSEYEIVRHGGGRAWVAWISTPVYDLRGQIRELLCVGNDVTERVKAERTIVEQRVRMAQASRLSAVGSMVSGLAHEINNPLATISVAAQQLGSLILNEQPDRKRLEKISEVIGRNTERISRIIRGLRMLSRDSGPDSFATASLRGLVADTLELCQARLDAHGIALAVSDIPAALEIECRPPQISQVLLNLLNNAYDAVENLPEKWIHLDVRDDGNVITIAVTDSGPGLPPEIREKMMIPFFTTKAPEKGMGLGLSISTRLIESHHGELDIDSDHPNTRFVVRLPKRQGHEAGR